MIIMENRKHVILLSVVTVISFICCVSLIKITADRPRSQEFCARCHSMKPFSDSWKETVACNAGCLDCHAHDKSGKTLSVEIEDQNCTATECHPVERLTSKLSDYKGISFFNHKTHLETYPTNLKLRCTGCHSYLGKSEREEGKSSHFGIDQNSCFVCHFTRGEDPLLTAKEKTAVDECSLCHRSVEAEVLIYEKVFNHLKFEKELRVKCDNCHFDTVQRGGDTEVKNCYHCHTKIQDEYQGAERMHIDHVVKHTVPCTPCHNEILHEWGDEYISHILPERRAVSRDKHSLRYLGTQRRAKQKAASVDTEEQESVFEKVPYLIQRRLYAGKGGIGIEKSPDPMYLALVNCTACHNNRDLSVHPLSCNVCHEKGFDKIMAEQKEYIKNRLRALLELIENSSKRGVPDTLIDEARHNYNFIIKDGSFGVHNIKYVKDLINYSSERLIEISHKETS